MFETEVTPGTTAKLIEFRIEDADAADGKGKTGIVYNSSGFTCFYFRQGAAATTGVALVTMNLGTWVTRGFKQVASGNMPGLYQFGVPDAALAAGADYVVIMFKGATGMVEKSILIRLKHQPPPMFKVVIDDAAVTPTTTVMRFQTGASTVSGAYEKQWLVFETGPNAGGRPVRISKYTGSTLEAIIGGEALLSIPLDDDVAYIVGRALP